MIDLTYIVIMIYYLYISYSGWIGVLLGLFVAPAQLYKIVRTKKVSGISIITYLFLVGAIFHYFIHAIDIGDSPFIVANGLNLSVNMLVFVLLFVYKRNT